jgi:hypothetical protein
MFAVLPGAASVCHPPVRLTLPGPWPVARSVIDCVSTMASIQAPCTAGITRTTTRCRWAGHACTEEGSPADAERVAGGSTHADSMRPSRGGTAAQSGSTARTIGQSAETVAMVCRQSAAPLSLCRNMPPESAGAARAAGSAEPGGTSGSAPQAAPPAHPTPQSTNRPRAHRRSGRRVVASHRGRTVDGMGGGDCPSRSTFGQDTFFAAKTAKNAAHTVPSQRTGASMNTSSCCPTNRGGRPVGSHS